MNGELSALASFAVGLPGTVFVIWVLLKFGSGEWQSRKQCDDQIAVVKESEKRAWDREAQARSDLVESTRVVEKVADAVAELTRAIQGNQGVRR